MQNIVGGPHSQGVTIQGGIADQYYNTELRLTPEERTLVLKHRSERAQREEVILSLITDAVASCLHNNVHDHIPNWPGTRAIAVNVRSVLAAKGLLKE